jgi:mannosyltransferase OCH1-like enzyme
MNSKFLELNRKLENMKHRIAENNNHKLENMKHRTVEKNTRTVENKPRTVENNTRTVENNTRTVENNPRTVENNPRTAENNPRTAENNTRTVENNTRTAENNTRTVENNLGFDFKKTTIVPLNIFRTVENNTRTVENNPRTVENNPRTVENNLGFNFKKTTIMPLNIFQTVENNTRTVENNTRTVENNPRTVENNTRTVENNPRTVENNPRTIENKPRTIENNLGFNVKKTTIIPLNIFQTWHTLDLPHIMNQCVEQLKTQNPEFKHYLYDDDMCREFIKDNFNCDVLYAFDKLKPGAYKSDLWRYCILYKKGGIYLDIKYYCVNGFKLLYLTDNEYFVQDRPYSTEKGVYNALMSVMPNSEIMLKCIETVVYNVSNGLFNKTNLDVTGPHIFLQFNPLQINIDLLPYIFKGDSIAIRSNGIDVLKQYNNYRREQQIYSNTKYYGHLWNDMDIYNYNILKNINEIDLTSTTTKIFKNETVKLYSGTPGIVEMSNNMYLVVMRWINYTFETQNNNDYIPVYNRPYGVSFNSFFLMDTSFNRVGPETFIKEPEIKEHFPGYGLEDIRLFNYNNEIYYIATYYDCVRHIPSTISGKMSIKTDKYDLPGNIILPNNMYDLNLIKIIEKNWSIFNYNNKIAIVYKWFPLQIGKIDYNNNKLNIIEIKYNIPQYFKDARGSTPGYIYNSEIWFVLHKTFHKSTGSRNYYHFFAVFDLNMNLLRYTDLFKFSMFPIEFCIGLIIKKEQIILTYSLMDTQSKIAIYELEWIETELKWFKYNESVASKLLS